MVAGATGLVGREILAALLADKRYSAVHTVGRSTLPLKHAKLVQHTADFSGLPKLRLAPALPPVDDVFIALGTTIKVAGSQAAFRTIDFDAVVALSQAALALGATHLGVVSAMGADPQASVFYSRVKGDMEAAVSDLGYPSVTLVRPSMLAGDRDALDQPTRLGERIGLSVMRWLKPIIPDDYKAVAARDVAAALVHAVYQGQPGVQRILSGALQGAAVGL